MYPTREQIMETPHLHKREVLRYAWEWKVQKWYPAKRTREDSLKRIALSELLRGIANIYNNPVNVLFSPSNSSCYVGATRTIVLSHPSIITGLHELAHHLFPRFDHTASETKACRWSVWLFKKVFRRSFETLEWHGHTLVRPETGSLPTEPPPPAE